jgi:hypothetical protein
VPSLGCRGDRVQRARQTNAQRAIKASWWQIAGVLVIVCALAIGLILGLSAAGLSPEIAKVIGASLASAFMYAFVARGRTER